VLKEHSILKKLKEAGLKPAFVNAYRPLFFKLKPKTQWRLSATTVANLAADLPFRTMEDLAAGNSLYHDFTNSFLLKYGFNLPLLTPVQAGSILAGLSLGCDFTMYEYFLTDRAGHTRDMLKAYPIVLQFDRFLGALLDGIDLDRTLVILAGDHGNVEDLSVAGHTMNRVPVMLWGKDAGILAPKIHSLTDVAPVILRAFGIGEGS
jgi:2,3-bisphosphoglycerate-independent phosphoglycerate mutase